MMAVSMKYEQAAVLVLSPQSLQDAAQAIVCPAGVKTTTAMKVDCSLWQQP